MTDQEARRFSKTVSIAEKDEDERIATGAVLVPNEVDHQGDFFRPEAIREFFEPEPDSGVMHAAFHDNAELVRNEVIDEPETLGGEEFPAGTWVASRQYHDGELWQLVSSGVLGGFSIGGEIERVIEHSAEDLPEDVRVPDGVELEGDATEAVDGSVHEISDVDHPAVPRAEHAVVKSLEKSIVDQVDGEDEFIQVMADRNPAASEDDLRRLWTLLQDLMTDENQAEADEQDEAEASKELDEDDVGFLKRLRSALTKSGEPDDGGNSLEVPDSETVDKALETAKAGRTLNSQNRQALMAAHDAVESALRSDVEFETNRFTDNPDIDFALAEHGDKPDEDKGGDSGPPWTTKDETMTDENDPMADAPEWAKALNERIDDVEKELEADSEESEKAEEEEAEKADETEEKPEWAKSLESKVDEIAKQGGASQQLGKAQTADSEEEGIEKTKRDFFLPESAR